MNKVERFNNVSFVTKSMQQKIIDNLPENVNAILVRGNLTGAERRLLDKIETYNRETFFEDVHYDAKEELVTNAAFFEVKSTNHLMQRVQANGYVVGGYPTTKTIEVGKASYSFIVPNTESNDFRYEGVILIDNVTKIPFYVHMFDEFVNLINRMVSIIINVRGDKF